MNFKIDVEMTPEELRQVLGLPDVAALQQDMLDQVRQRMESGAEGYDPMTLFKPYLTGGLGSMEAFQALLLKMMSNYPAANAKKDSDKGGS